MHRWFYVLTLVCAAQAADWKKEAVFHATFDGSVDARVASGDPKLYSSPSYKEQASAQTGLAAAQQMVRHAKGEGRSGDTLHQEEHARHLLQGSRKRSVRSIRRTGPAQSAIG